MLHGTSIPAHPATEAAIIHAPIAMDMETTLATNVVSERFRVSIVVEPDVPIHLKVGTPLLALFVLDQDAEPAVTATGQPK